MSRANEKFDKTIARHWILKNVLYLCDELTRRV